MRRHRSGVSLAFAAPLDCLYAATEVNEWAWWAAVLLPTRAFPPPLQGEGRGGDGFPVGQGDVKPHSVRAETHPLQNPPLEGEGRSEERRVGKTCVRSCRSRGAP